MTNRQIVEDLLRQIPEDASLHEIAEKIEFIAAVRQGEHFSIDDVGRELPSWIIK